MAKRWFIKMMNNLRQTGRDIIYNYSTVVMAQFLCLPIAIFYTSMVTRMLGPEKFGHLTFFLAIVQFYFCVFANWSRSSIIRFTSEAFAKAKDTKGIVGSQLLISFGSFILAVLIIFLMRAYLKGMLYLGANAYLWIILYLAAYISSDFILQFLRAQHRIRAYAGALILRQSSSLVFFALMFIILKLEAEVSHVIILEVMSYLLILIIFMFTAFSRRSLSLIFSGTKKKIKEMLWYSWPLIITVILGYGMAWLDTWVIKFFLTYTSVGEYGVANGLIELISNAIMPLSIIGFPLMVSLKAIEKNALIHTFATKIVPQLCFFWSLIILFLIFASKIIIYLMFGKAFLPSVTPFQILLIGLCFQILPVLYTSILLSFDRTQRVVLIAFIALAVNLFLDLILIKKYGISGIAVSKTCALIVCGLLCQRSALRCLGEKNNSYGFYAFLLIPPGAILVLHIFKQSQLGFLSVLFLCILAILIGKKSGIFSEEAWLFWERIKMPNSLRCLYREVYAFFS